jgi:hypothetical protein
MVYAFPKANHSLTGFQALEGQVDEVWQRVEAAGGYL